MIDKLLEISNIDDATDNDLGKARIPRLKRAGRIHTPRKYQAHKGEKYSLYLRELLRLAE